MRYATLLLAATACASPSFDIDLSQVRACNNKKMQTDEGPMQLPFDAASYTDWGSYEATMQYQTTSTSCIPSSAMPVCIMYVWLNTLHTRILFFELRT